MKYRVIQNNLLFLMIILVLEVKLTKQRCAEIRTQLEERRGTV